MRRASFVVRAVQDRSGQLTGIVERVATGAKETFIGMEAIGPLIARMLQIASSPSQESPPSAHPPTKGAAQ